jgi:hypothetical protein
MNELGVWEFVGLVYQGKEDIVFRFIIEYSSLRDFYRPPSNNNNNRSIFYIRIFWKMIFWLEISYRVIISLKRILVSFRQFFEDYIFAWWNIWVSIMLILPLRYLNFFNVNGKATQCDAPHGLFPWIEICSK